MIPMFSCISGQQISPADLDAAYWRRTMYSPVNFNESISNLIENSDKTRLFVEVGPQSVLLSPIKQIHEASKAQSKMVYVPTLLKDQNSMECVLRTAGELYMYGVTLDMAAINGNGKVLTDIPPYPWQHEKQLWYESRIAHNWRTSKFAHHELLGHRSPESPDLEPFWRNRLQLKCVPWLLDHKVNTDIVYPCVGYISMIGEAIRQITGSKCFSIKRLFMSAPMVLYENSTTEIMTNLRPARLTDSARSSWYDITISAYDGKQWSTHCTGQARGENEDHLSAFNSSSRPFARQVDTDVWYETTRKAGLDFGPSFRRLTAITADPISYYASATVAQNELKEQIDRDGIDPVIIDQGLQLLVIAACNGLSRRMSKLGVPMSIDYLYVSDAQEITGSETGIALRAEFPVCENGKLKNSLGGCVSGSLDGNLSFNLKGVKFFPLRQSRASTEIPLATRLEWKPDIDFLPAKEYLFKSMPENPSMALLTKLLVIAVIELFDQMGFRPSTFSSAAEYQDWTTSNLGRLHEILQSYFPDAFDWNQDPISLQSMLIKDVSTLVESTEPWVQPVRDYVTKILDAIDDQVPISDLLMDNRGFRSLWEFAAINTNHGQMFCLLGHSNPSLAVLEVNPSTCGTTSGALVVLQSVDGVPLYSKYTVASDSTDIRTEALDRFGETEGFSSVALNPKVAIGAHDFASKSYDLIILPNDLPSVYEVKPFLAEMKTLLAPGGRLFIRELTPRVPLIEFMMSMIPPQLSISSELQLQNSFSPEFWTMELNEAGFLPPEFHSFDLNIYPWTLEQAMISKAPHPELERHDVFLLGPVQSHPWTESVRHHLIERGYNVVDATLEELPSGEGDIISVLDIPTPTLSNFSQEKHDALMKLCLQGRRTIWATKASQMKCDNPSFGLINGFARTIRQETMSEFGTIEIDNFDQHAARTLVKVYEKFRRQSLAHSWAPECEFALLDKVVHIGRFHWVPLEKISLPAPQDCHIALEVGAPGIGNLLTWKEQPDLSLNEHDVEVDMSYVAVNFRVCRSFHIYECC
jgi:SAM-dependent methyltransferase